MRDVIAIRDISSSEASPMLLLIRRAEKLFVPEGDHRIDAHGAASRNVTGRQRNAEQNDRHGSESQGIACGNTIEQDMRRVSRRATTIPTPKPNMASFVPCPRINRNTSRRPAPSATRIPISCVPCDAEYDITPKIPMAASTRAIALNEPSRNVRNRSCEIDFPSASFKGSMSVTGRLLSMERTAWRMPAATLDALNELLTTTSPP